MIEVRTKIRSEQSHRILIQTILNHVQKFKCFVYDDARMIQKSGTPELEIAIRERSNSKAVCSGCGKRRSGYDRLPVRRYEFIPIWGVKVFYRYAPRRVNCPSCGVVVEKLPWASGKKQLTETYAWFLAGWAKRLSGFRTFYATEIALFHALGALPVPKTTHEFF